MRLTFYYLCFWLISQIWTSTLISSDSVLLVEDDTVREELLAAYSISGPLDAFLLASNNSNASLTVELSQIKAHFLYPASSFKNMLEYEVKEKTYCACNDFAGLFGSTLSKDKCEEEDFSCKVEFHGLPGNIKGSDCLVDFDAGYCFGVCFREKNKFPMYQLDNPVLQGFSFMYQNDYVFVKPEHFEKVGGVFNISFSSNVKASLPVSLNVVCEKQSTCWIIPPVSLNFPNECNPKKINPYLDACLPALYTVGVKSCKNDLFQVVPIKWLTVETCPDKSLISPTNIRSGQVELSRACHQGLNTSHCLVVANNTEYYFQMNKNKGVLSRADGQEIKAPAYILNGNSSLWLSPEGLLFEAVRDPIHTFHMSVDVTDVLITVRTKNLTGAILSSECAVIVAGCTEARCTISQDRCSSRFCVFEKFGDNYAEDHIIIEFSPDGLAEIPRQTGSNVGTVICGGVKSVLVYTKSEFDEEDRNLSKNETRSSSTEEGEEEGGDGLRNMWNKFTAWLSGQKAALIGTIAGVGVLGSVGFVLAKFWGKKFLRRPRFSSQNKERVRKKKQDSQSDL